MTNSFLDIINEELTQFKYDVQPHPYRAWFKKQLVCGTKKGGLIYRAILFGAYQTTMRMEQDATFIYGESPNDPLLIAKMLENEIYYKFVNPDRKFPEEINYHKSYAFMVDHKVDDVYAFTFGGYYFPLFDYRVRLLLENNTFSSVDRDLRNKGNTFLAKVINPKMLVKFKLEEF